MDCAFYYDSKAEKSLFIAFYRLNKRMVWQKLRIFAA